MDNSIHYENAPITEAIIDIRVNCSTKIESLLLKKIGDDESKSYPKHEEIFEAVGEVAVGPTGGAASVRQQESGWKFSSEDGKQILQCRQSGFTFSRLAPYESWRPFRDEAHRLWSNYRRRIQPKRVIRLAVRYINRIDIPGESIDLKEYFRTSPEIAPELPQQLEGYFMQLRVLLDEIVGTGIITQTIVRPARQGVVSIVLDIDLFRTENPPQSEDDIWEFFDSLHLQKNHIFEASITDSTRRLFAPCPS